MIRTEVVEINGTQFQHVWSDDNRVLCRDGQQWSDVYDPIDANEEYAEGEKMDDEATAIEVLDILLGGTDD